MGKFYDSLRGYSIDIHKRDQFKCCYCGVDGSKSFDTWLSLSWDHMLPKGHPNRDKKEFIVTACNFCNTADNRYFEKAKMLNLKFDGISQVELIEQRKKYVMQTRNRYRKFWESNVRKG